MDCYAVIAAWHNARRLGRADNRLMDGLVLLAHGARDPRWREPFERLARKVRAARSDVVVTLAFLQSMEPTLDIAVDDLAEAGCTRIRVVPVFLGQGGHVREDIPAAVERARERHSRIAITLLRAVGEDDAVLERIAAVAMDGL
jgi:sirohydrochlorin cobaltochelatase